MTADERLVLDTNVVVSGILFAGSIPSRALLKAQDGRVLVSAATKSELIEVMNRTRFDRYVEAAVRRGAIAGFLKACEMVEIPFPIRACRDPRDDKFLEVAIHGRADLIVSGDDDLLHLHPFRGIVILTPADFLDRS